MKDSSQGESWLVGVWTHHQVQSEPHPGGWRGQADDFAAVGVAVCVLCQLCFQCAAHRLVQAVAQHCGAVGSDEVVVIAGHTLAGCEFPVPVRVWWLVQGAGPAIGW